MTVVHDLLAPVSDGPGVNGAKSTQPEHQLVLGCNCSDYCHAHCLHSAVSTELSSSSEPQEELELDNVPREYHNLKLLFFRKDRAQSLPPHHPYDCAVDLLPGAVLPTMNYIKFPILRKWS